MNKFVMNITASLADYLRRNQLLGSEINHFIDQITNITRMLDDFTKMTIAIINNLAMPAEYQHISQFNLAEKIREIGSNIMLIYPSTFLKYNNFEAIPASVWQNKAAIEQMIFHLINFIFMITPELKFLSITTTMDSNQLHIIFKINKYLEYSSLLSDSPYINIERIDDKQSLSTIINMIAEYYGYKLKLNHEELVLVINNIENKGN